MMIHAQLIVGGTPAERLTKAHALIEKNLGQKLDLAKGHPDLLLLEPDASIGIEKIRWLQKKLALKPYSSAIKVALIRGAERLTIPAQNALLKTLEEPPANSLVILTASKVDLLLPTVVSRCQLIKLPAKTEIEVDKETINYQLSTINLILKSGVGGRIKMASGVAKNRDGAIKFCQAQLLLWREMLLTKIASLSQPKTSLTIHYSQLTTQQLVQTLHSIQETLSLLEANVNVRLALEALLLSYPSLNRA